MLEIDGGRHSGSGSIVRLTAAYAALTDTSVHVVNAHRAKRDTGVRPGNPWPWFHMRPLPHRDGLDERVDVLQHVPVEVPFEQEADGAQRAGSAAPSGTPSRIVQRRKWMKATRYNGSGILGM